MFITTVLTLCVVCSHAFINVSAHTLDNNLNETSNNFSEESIEKLIEETGINSIYKGMNLTYTVDDNNNIVRIDPSNNERSLTLTIAVLVGTYVVGYITSSVIDGIVISATGESGGYWVAQAISKVLNQPYQKTVTIDCDYYAPHSQEYYFCIYGA